ncbi:MAG: winged helix-turn-helix domain-containing protein [Solirubrobacterales bacterium]
MTAAEGKGVAASRAGSLALSILAVPLSLVILETLAKSPKTVDALRRVCGSPPATVRRHLRTLTRASTVERLGGGEPSTAAFGLTAAGHELLRVATALKDWLTLAPTGAVELGDPAARQAIKALVDSWSLGIVRVLAARPLSRAELEQIGRGAGLAAAEDRLGPMLEAGLVEQVPGSEPAARYGASPLLRRAIGPLAVAARWERRRGFDETNSISRLDVESAFLLTTPLVRLSSRLGGTCRVTVDVGDAVAGGRHVGALITVERGGVTSCVAPPSGHAQSWASGSAKRWLDAVIDGETEGLQVGGNERLAGALLDGLHVALFKPHAPAPS